MISVLFSKFKLSKLIIIHLLQKGNFNYKNISLKNRKFAIHYKQAKFLKYEHYYTHSSKTNIR